MNCAGLILMAITILLFKDRSGTTLLTFDTEVHSQEKTLRVCSFLYTVLHYSPGTNKILYWNRAKKYLRLKYMHSFLSKHNSHLLIASVYHNCLLLKITSLTGED